MLNIASPSFAADPINYINEPEPSDTLVLMQCVLEQMDYGLALVHMATRQIRFANRLAHDALSGPGSLRSGLCMADGRLSTQLRTDTPQLEHAMLRAQTGVRALISLGGEDSATSVALVPLNAPGAAPYALLVFAKQQLCDSSTMALFARERGLTSAESNVLASVCSGMRPTEIATHHGVQISTVRSQLRSIRIKTRCDTIRQLVETVSILPPMARHLAAVQH
ncbi:MAG: helix-turn-helix transcriptional regulator [Rhodoferax sp.]|uniref:helix-turn-helix transcriptional regulator n=1 Tax=Rhodoferax sp. TaxID=50421 RepID=UPI003265119D